MGDNLSKQSYTATPLPQQPFLCLLLYTHHRNWSHQLRELAEHDEVLLKLGLPGNFIQHTARLEILHGGSKGEEEKQGTPDSFLTSR